MKQEAELTGKRWDFSSKGYNDIIQKEFTEVGDVWVNLVKDNAPVPTGKALDVGMGPGFFTIILAALGWDAAGVDCSADMVAVAKENLQHRKLNAQCFRMDSHALDFPDNTFDYIVARNATWLLYDPETAFREWLRVLKPGGRLMYLDANWPYLDDPEMTRKLDEAYREYEEANGKAFNSYTGDKDTDDSFKKLVAIGYVLAPAYLKWIRTPEAIQESAVSYLRIYFLSFISVVTYNFGSGVLRAVGDSESPLHAQICGGLMNVAMDYLFIRVFNDGVNGVAWATLISQTTAAAVIVYKLVNLDPEYALRSRKIAFDKDILRQVINIGVPAGTQSLVITLSNVIVQYHINGFGEDAIAAFTAYFKVELLIYSPIVALGQAAMTFSGQNKGAGNWKRIREGTIRCALISMGLAAVTAVISIPFGGYLFRLFNKEPAVIELGRKIIGTTFPLYFVYSILQIFGDSMRGLGKSKVPMIIILINICLIRTILLFLIVPRNPTVSGVAMVYPITWSLTAVCMLTYFILYHRNHIREELHS